MKKVIVWIIVLLIYTTIFPTQLSAEGDKIKHFGISLLFGAAGESYLHYATDLEGDIRVFFGTALGTLPGLFKEVIDNTKEGNRFSGGDMAADILGSFCGALLSNVVNNKIHVNINLNKKRQLWIVSVSLTF